MRKWTYAGLAILAFAAGCTSSEEAVVEPVVVSETSTTLAQTSTAPSSTDTSSTPNEDAPAPSSEVTPSTTLLGAADAEVFGDVVWSEDFDTIDPSRWQVEFSDYGADDSTLQCYRPGNVETVDGILRLTATEGSVGCTNGQSLDFASGMIRSERLVDWRYGKFEIVAQFPAGAGLWPALWMSPTQDSFGSWPRSGEIDIAEARGDDRPTTTCSAHFWNPETESHDKSVGKLDLGEDLTTGFHTYGLEWTPEELRWTVDGEECHRASLASLGAAGPFDEPFYLKLNLAVGGNWVGAPDASTSFPAVMKVDSIRVFEFVSDPSN